MNNRICEVCNSFMGLHDKHLNLYKCPTCGKHKVLPKPPEGNKIVKINQEGLELIKNFEGLELKAYLDAVNVPTIGYGHTGPDVRIPMTITKEEALKLLDADIAKFEQGVENLVKVPVSSNQFSALVSFAFNVGLGNLKSSTLLRLLNAGEAASKVAEQFHRWKFAGKKELPGLVRRRAAEAELFLKA